MKKIFNSIKHKNSRENVQETRRSREVRRSTDIRRDNQPVSQTTHNPPVASNAVAPSHPALNLNSSPHFLDASEFSDNTPRHLNSTSLGGDERLMTEPHSKRYSEDVADRNMDAHIPRTSLTKDTPSSTTAGSGLSDPLNRKVPSGTPSHVVNTTTTTTVDVDHKPSAIQAVSPTSNTASRNVEQPISNSNAGNASALGVAANSALPSKTTTAPTSTALPTNAHSTTLPMASGVTPINRENASARPKTLDPDVRLPSNFDINDSEDTETLVTYAKAVVQETVKPQRHHVVHEHIIREIHNHTVYHRVLPIIDVEVLPAKHYIQDPKNPLKLLEVAEHEVPGYRGPGKHNWQIVETVSRLEGPPPAHRVGGRFTAKTFAPGEGATKEWVDENGVERSERTWIHSPVSARREGTVPLYMGYWPEHEVSATGESNPGWPGMPAHHVGGHGLEAHNTALGTTSTAGATGAMPNLKDDSQVAYRPTAGARSASNRSDYLRMVDPSLETNKPTETRANNGIETVNSKMSMLNV